MYRQYNAERCLHYSHQRVKQILKDDYHCHLQPINGYKSNRQKGYVQHYHLINDDTGETLAQNITLNALRILLTQENYPLHEDCKPYKDAIDFLAYIVKIQKGD